MRTRIKFCGCTSAREAEMAIDCGVDAVGVIFAPASPRCVSWDVAREIAQAVPAFVSLVGVVVDPAAEDAARAIDAGYLLQFSGEETAQRCESLALGPYIKVHHIAVDAPADAVVTAFDAVRGDYGRATWMFDSIVDGKRGGTGRSFDWSSLSRLAATRRVIMSGGLTPETVGRCVALVRPLGVDVRSGIETNGVKDIGKMRAFVRAVKECDEQA